MKRIAAMALSLLFMFSICAGAAVSVRLDEGALLLDESGELIVPMGKYSDIVSLGNGFFAAETDGCYALMDAGGRLLTQAVYSDMRMAGDALLAVKNGSWGILGLDGREKSAFDFGSIITGAEGGFWAVRGNTNDEESDELFLLDMEGRERAAGIFVRSMQEDASEGLLAVQLPESGLWGYCNLDGQMVIPSAYSYAGEFICDRAAVVIRDRYFAIDASGTQLFASGYDFLEISPAGFMIASRSMEGTYLLDMDGNILSAFKGEDVYAALAGEGFIIADARQLRLFDASGREVAVLAPDAAVYEGIENQMIFSEGAWGEECVYLQGTQAYRQNIYPLGVADGEAIYACMQANAARYMNDTLGEIQVSVDMESARYGVINARGEELLPCEYQTIEYLANNRLLVHADGLTQMIDAEGRVYWSHGVRQTEEPIS